MAEKKDVQNQHMTAAAVECECQKHSLLKEVQKG